MGQLFNLRYTNNLHGMKHLIAIMCATIFLLAGLSSALAQHTAFSAVNDADRNIRVENLFAESGLIKTFVSKRRASGVSITGDIWLNSDSSLVRVILVDIDFNEYLVYEAYPLLESSAEFSLERACEETALLNNVIPFEMRIEIIDAVLFLKFIHLSPATVYTAKSSGDTRRAQQQNKIDRLNQNLAARDIPWVAGETSFSQLSYEEKKASFGGELPNLSGFEFYTGGIFVMPGALLNGEEEDVPNVGDSPYAVEFDWRNRHGKNWLSPVKSQGSCGSCWAFAAVGATEHLANIYFNKKLDLNLSEQQLVSCGNSGSCNGGWVYSALSYIQYTGLAEEDCFPYMASNANCLSLCSEPEENLRIGSYRNHLYGSTNAWKQRTIEGAVTFGIIPWHHALTLVGYKTLQTGDRVYIKTSSESRWFTIDSKSELVGRTAWILKNSWGTWWGDEGYAYVVTNLNEISSWHTCQLYGPVSSTNFNDTDILCTDNDGDGYYYWGIGPKPAHCPPCPDEPDGDDSNACFGPMDEYGKLQAVTSSPTADDVTIFEEQEVPDLNASGTNIKWYSDYYKSQLLHSGPIYNTGINSLGSHTFYVTQTIGACESAPQMVMLTILKGTTPPEVEDLRICQGKTGILKAIGSNIRWYSDQNLSNLLHEGEQYLPAETDPGYYRYYVTQSTGGVESPYVEVFYTITGTPLPVYVEDKTYCTEEGLFMFAKGVGIKWYKSGFINELIDERDNRSYKLVNIGTQVWMAENLNIGERIDGSIEQTDNEIIEKYNYSDNPDYGPDYGGLYQWDELMLYTTEVGTRGICPAGWHIPSHEEWKQMEIELGMKEEEADKLGLRGSDEGARLLEGGSAGFEALFGGKRNTDGYYQNMDYYASFWTSDGYSRTLSEAFDQVYASKGDSPENGFSVRCVLDESSIVSDGNKLDLSDYTPGDYSFKVTSTILGCESNPVSSNLTLNQTPEPPVVPDIEACANEPSPFLVAEGEGIKWYLDLPDDPLLDQRDGRIYDVIGLGKQVWMAENLDVGEQIPGSQNQGKNGVIEKYYYDDNPVLGEAYGGLYQWPELMDYTIEENARGICPDGWEIPSNSDWMKLEMELGMTQSEAALYEWRGTDQGTQLKVGGSSGFDVVFGGKRDEEGVFRSDYYYATLWNSSAYSRTFERGPDTRPQVFNSRFDDPRNAYSLRCMMNDSAYTTRGNIMAIPGNEPGTYHFEVTRTIDGCESESTPATLILKDAPIPPVGKDTSICQGDSIPELEAGGEDISWYSEIDPDQMLHSGNTYHTSDSLPGIYNYYITQSGADCESRADTVSLEIKTRPEHPIVHGAEICEGDSVPDLLAEGVDIKWYSDQAIQDFLGSGPVYTSENTEHGQYSYFATQTMNSCEGPASQIVLTINPIPEISLGNDTLIYTDETLVLGPYLVEYSYLWDNTTENAFLLISGEEYGVGEFPVSVQVMYKGCVFRDSLMVTVENRVGVNTQWGKEVHKIYPNPTEGDFTLEFSSFISQDILVELYRSNGSLVQQLRYKDLPQNSRSSFKIHLDTPGLYYLKIFEKEGIRSYPVIKL